MVEFVGSAESFAIVANAGQRHGQNLQPNCNSNQPPLHPIYFASNVILEIFIKLLAPHSGGYIFKFSAVGCLGSGFACSIKTTFTGDPPPLNLQKQVGKSISLLKGAFSLLKQILFNW